MSLLRDVIKDLNESAAGGATGGGAVAAYAGPLFGGKPQRRSVKAHRIQVNDMQKTIKNRNAMKWRIIGEMVDDSTFDASDVLSKLDAAEKKSKIDRDTTPFGMEDDQGNIVKVYVRSDQADEFENALAAMLSGQDEDGDEQSTPVEIAEVLFQLKDKFDIVDVEWPEIEGDEEEEQEMEGDEGGMDLGAEGEGDLGAEGGMDLGAEGEGDLGAEGGMDLGEEPAMEPEGGAESALQQVIDMMKADAEARKAESEARAKEAEARAAEANASAAASKVKQEEEVLDMESFNKQKKEEEEEAKRLAKLAKWKHDQASSAETRLSQEEEEASVNDTEPHRTRPAEDGGRTITKDELMQKILHYLRSN